MTTVFNDSFSEEVWSSTYKDHTDNNIEDTFRRVANAIASVENTEKKKQDWEDKFFDMLQEFKVVPGGRILSNAGTDWKGTTLINCFVAPRASENIDSLDGILWNLRNQSMTLKSEGGWGENFSYIRPRGSMIYDIGAETPGSVKFMELFDKSSDVITAGSGRKNTNAKAKGKIRKGAQMAVLDCLAGNTPINTIEGRIPIKDLVGKCPYLYCTDQKGNVYVRQATKVWSKGIKKTIKIVFDNDTFMECTPEHEIMLSDGTYKKAQDLCFYESVAVLNKRLLNDYLHLGITGSRKVIAEHNAVYEMMYGKYPTIVGGKRSPDSTVAHHIDHVKWNNHPENIQSMTLSNHGRHHSEHIRKCQTDRAIRQKGTTNDEFYGEEKAAEIKAKRQQTEQVITRIAWNKEVTGEKYKTHYTNGFGGWAKNTNHKVVRIEESIEQEVFDISMPDYHNFVANDVFVHNCWHPDVIEFITAKQQPGRLAKFNVSVNCTDEFMQKLISVNEAKRSKLPQQEIDILNKWELQFPDTQHPNYKLEWTGSLSEWKEKGYPTIIYNTVEVTWLWELIMKSTYNRAEPGVLFLDRANHFNPLNYAEKIAATNPCGEQVLAPGGICCLGSINLTQFINDDCTDFLYKKIEKYASYLVRFLDNVNSYSMTPLPEYDFNMKNKRRIGIGIMGWGSSLIMFKTRYGSDKAEEIRNKLMNMLSKTVYKASIDLAEEKGMFSLCEPEKHITTPFLQKLNLPIAYVEKLRTFGIRNSSLLSIQPTGNTAIVANVVSGGCEPLFMHEYVRTVIVGSMPEHIASVTPKWYEGEWYETQMFKKVKEGDEEILRGTDVNGTIYKIDRNRGLTKEVLCEDYGVRFLKIKNEWDPKATWAATTTNLEVSDHLRELKGFAQYVDSAISKTINLPHDYSYDNFQNLYLDAYKTGYIKGLTTYRANTMSTVLAAKEEINSEEEIIKEDVKLPDSSPATIKVLKAEARKWYVTVVYYENNHKPFALFVQTNDYEKNVVAEEAVELLIKLARKKGIPKRHIDAVILKIEADNNVNKIARLLSFVLRHGVLIKNIVAILDKVESAYAGSFVFAIKKFLGSYIKDGENVEDEKCMECGSDKIVFSEGCKKCISCGSSKCG